MNEFKKLGLSEKILSAIDDLGYTEPTEIQTATIPMILKGADVIGNAATGSGKTLAFASGIIERCVPHEGIQALVLAPTRELAEQITKVIRDFAKHFKLRIKDVYGGVSFERQVDEIRGAEVIV